MDAKTLRASLILRAMEGKLVPRGHERGTDYLREILASEEIRRRPKNISKGILPVENYEDVLTVPEGWGMCRLGQISSVFEYGTSTKCHESPDDNDVIVLRMPNIQDGDIDFTKLKYANQNSVDGLFCKKDDLLFNRTNSMELVGKCASVKFSQDNVSFASYLIRVHLVGMDPEFVNFFINSLDCRYKQIIPNATQQNGQANFSGGKLKNVVIPVPALEEQRRIVAHLNELLPLVDKFGKAQEALVVAQKEFPKKLKASLLQEAIQGKLVPQLDEEPAVEQIGEAPEDVPFAIPEEWTWANFNTVITTITTKKYQIPTKEIKSSGKFPVISQSKQAIDGFSDDIDRVVPTSNLPCVLFGDHTRVVKKITAPCIIGADGTKLITSTFLDNDFLFYLISSISPQLREAGYSRHFKFLKAHPLPIPPIAEQRRIVARLNELLPLVDRMVAQATANK